MSLLYMYVNINQTGDNEEIFFVQVGQQNRKKD